MPFYRGEPWAPLPLPQGLQPHEEVFVLRQTGEVFRDYEMYLGSFKELRERVWSCPGTGRSNLTYEEAALEEETARRLRKQVRNREITLDRARSAPYNLCSDRIGKAARWALRRL
jgi:ATP-utilising chromatin assembly and remodelling N-terminal